MPVRAIRPEDAWCEDPASRHYNQPMRLGPDQGGDRLTRDDHLYDFIVEIDHNAAPRIAGRGSAVFLHLARKDFSPTAGCVSMTQSGDAAFAAAAWSANPDRDRVTPSKDIQRHAR